MDLDMASSEMSDTTANAPGPVETRQQMDHPSHLDRELLAVEEFERTSDFNVDFHLD